MKLTKALTITFLALTFVVISLPEKLSAGDIPCQDGCAAIMDCPFGTTQTTSPSCTAFIGWDSIVLGCKRLYPNCSIL